ncbi:MAG: 30S ribosomal protein S9 [Planctomycetaceae bacterium]|nr:30S ribosomal protein S9 [Planctomycetaceae bacterium]
MFFPSVLARKEKHVKPYSSRRVGRSSPKLVSSSESKLLREHSFLTRDAQEAERKKCGLRKVRSGTQLPKR